MFTRTFSKGLHEFLPPKGPEIETNSRSPSKIEIFKQEWKVQASHPPRCFLFEILKVKIEHVEVQV